MNQELFEKNCKALLEWDEDDEYPFVNERTLLIKQLIDKTLPQGFEHKMLQLHKLLNDGTYIWFRVIRAPWGTHYGIMYSEYDGVFNIKSFDKVEPVERKQIVWKVCEEEKCI